MFPPTAKTTGGNTQKYMTKEELRNLPTEKLIERYDIIIAYNVPDRLCVRATNLAKREQAVDILKARKQEILQFLRAKKESEERARAEREAKLAAIPGLSEIEAAMDDLDQWHDEWDRSFNDVGGLNVRPKPKYDFHAMKEKYPQAFAYLEARKLSLNYNAELSDIGKRAVEEVINGDYKRAMENLKKEKEEFAARHALD